MKVPRLDITVEDAHVRVAIMDSIAKVVSGGAFIGGQVVHDLEFLLSQVVDDFSRPVPLSVITCASGTDALALALLGRLGIHDEPPSKAPEVVVPALTFSATASAVLRAGLRPRFVDIDPATFLIDWVQAEDVASRGAMSTIVPVHLYGRLCRPPKNLDPSIAIIEDACQAFGLPDTGRLGLLAALSFFPSKPLGCYGDGGAVVCPATMANYVRALAHHGSIRRYVSQYVGFNSRLDAIQAAVLREKLPFVDAHRADRKRIAHRYEEGLRDVDGIQLPELVDDHTWHCYVIRVEDVHGCTPGSRREALSYRLRESGIESAVHYPVPLHRQPAFASIAGDLTLPHTELACAQVLSLPIWSGMIDAQIDHVISTIRSF